MPWNIGKVWQVDHSCLLAEHPFVQQDVMKADVWRFVLQGISVLSFAVEEQRFYIVAGRNMDCLCSDFDCLQTCWLYLIRLCCIICVYVEGFQFTESCWDSYWEDLVPPINHHQPLIRAYEASITWRWLGPFWVPGWSARHRFYWYQLSRWGPAGWLWRTKWEHGWMNGMVKLFWLFATTILQWSCTQ